jgi:2-polyprenyl-3-methyl-5-hydroxy-6-metoxy-1,4-benzoquinol methylase
MCRVRSRLLRSASSDRLEVVRRIEHFDRGSLHCALIRDSPGRFDRYRALANTRYDHYSKVLARANFSLLEVGCGDAGMAAEMGAHGVDYQGIDIDPRRSRRHGPEGSSPAASATSCRATRT